MTGDNNPNSKPPRNPGGDDKQPKSNIWVAITITILIVLVFSMVFNSVSASQYTQTTFSDFLKNMESGNLSEVQFQSDRVIYMTKEEARKDPNEQKACFTGLPSGGDTLELSRELEAMGVVVDRQIVEDNSTFIMILYYASMLLLTFFMIRTLMKRVGSPDGGFGKSKAKVYMEKKTGVTFADVAGQDEAKESLQEIILTMPRTASTSSASS